MFLLRGRRWGRRSAALAAVGALGMVLAACSSSPAATTTSSSTTSAAAATGTTVASSSSATYGTILVTSSGMTLYMLTADSPAASVCASSCVSIWPPLTTTGTPRAGSGVQGHLLGTITRSDGSRQVTYDGHPLYSFASDTAAGQVNGEGVVHFGGTWYVLGTSGNPVTAAVSSSTTTTTSGGGYGGY